MSAADMAVPPPARESGSRPAARPAPAVDEKRLRDAAFHAIGSFGDTDDDQVLSCLDALAVDMRVLEVVLQSPGYESYGITSSPQGLVDIESSVGRFVGRVKAIRELHIELRNQREARPTAEAISSFKQGIAVGEIRYRAAVNSCSEKVAVAQKALDAGHSRKAKATLDQIQADVVKVFAEAAEGDRMTAELDAQVSQ